MEQVQTMPPIDINSTATTNNVASFLKSFCEALESNEVFKFIVVLTASFLLLTFILLPLNNHYKIIPNLLIGYTSALLNIHFLFYYVYKKPETAVSYIFKGIHILPYHVIAVLILVALLCFIQVPSTKKDKKVVPNPIVE